MTDKNDGVYFRNILVCYNESAIERSLAVDEESFRSGMYALLCKDTTVTFTKTHDLPSQTDNYELLLLIESFSEDEVVQYLKSFSGRTVFYSLCSQDRFFERVRFFKENKISLLLVSQKRYLQKYHLMDIHGHYLPLLLPSGNIRLPAFSNRAGIQLAGPSRKYSSSDDDLNDFAYCFFEKQPDAGINRQVLEDRVSEWNRCFRSDPEQPVINGIVKVYDDEDLEIDVIQAIKAGCLVFIENRLARHFNGILEMSHWMVFDNISQFDSFLKEIQAYDNQKLKKIRDNNESFFRSSPYLNTGDTLMYLIFDYQGHYERVKMNFAKKNISDTFSSCQEILKHHPDDPYTLHILGMFALHINHQEDAEHLLQMSFGLDHGIPEAIYALVNIYKDKNTEYYDNFYKLLCNYVFACNMLSVTYAGILNVPHIEIQRMEPYCKGVGLDIGCGTKKSFKGAIGIDLVPRGKKGKYGSQSGLVSDADICGDGAHLPCKDNSVDYLVSKHNFEHYAESGIVLKEWIRVVKPDGIVGLVVPDDCFGNSINLDPTHKQAFTLDSLRKFVEQFDDVVVLETGRAVPYWSIYCILKKKYRNS